MVESAKESIKQRAAKSEIYSKMQAVFVQMDSTQFVSCLLKIFFITEMISSGCPHVS